MAFQKAIILLQISLSFVIFQTASLNANCNQISKLASQFAGRSGEQNFEAFMQTHRHRVNVRPGYSWPTHFIDPDGRYVLFGGLLQLQVFDMYTGRQVFSGRHNFVDQMRERKLDTALANRVSGFKWLGFSNHKARFVVAFSQLVAGPRREIWANQRLSWSNDYNLRRVTVTPYYWKDYETDVEGNSNTRVESALEFVGLTGYR